MRRAPSIQFFSGASFALVMAASIAMTLPLLSPRFVAGQGHDAPPGCAEEGTGEVPVAIHSNPSGVHLRFVQDGETRTRGRTPFARLLPAGEYEVIATAGKGKQERRTLVARQGEAVALVFRFD